MSSGNHSPFVDPCLQCGALRSVKKRDTRSLGLCHSCAAKRGTRPRHHSLYAEEVMKRFWSHVEKVPGPDACWLWTGAGNRNGYGTFTVHLSDGTKRTMEAHRYAFQAEHGVLPSTVFVLHKPPCVNRRCVRHLYAGTQQDNANDAKTLGRFATGDRHGLRLHPESVRRGDQHPLWHNYAAVRHGEESGLAKLTNDEVLRLRTLWATHLLTRAELASMFDIHPVHVWKIVTNRARQNG